METLEGLQEIYYSYLLRLANKSPRTEEMDFEFHKTMYTFSSKFLSGGSRRSVLWLACVWA